MAKQATAKKAEVAPQAKVETKKVHTSTTHKTKVGN